MRPRWSWEAAAYAALGMAGGNLSNANYGAMVGWLIVGTTVLAVATYPKKPLPPHRCPDCRAPLPADMDPDLNRCGYPPAQGAVRGHGTAPRNPPPPASRPPTRREP